MSRFWIGTSGWNYKHWRGIFYPEKLPVSRWFDFFQQHFSTVEINNTFYREAPDKTYDSWRDQAPEGFCYAVKAHRYLTHLKRLHEPADSLERVVKGARRLDDHLGPLLYQLPPAFKRTDENVERLADFLRILPQDLKHCVEFRDKSWWETPHTFDLLREHNVAFCCHDSRGTETPCMATADFAYIRFHGGVGHSGNYSQNSLRESARRLERLAADGCDVYAYFNNDVGGHAIHNAQTLAEMLSVELPSAA